jgi:hypothetical protein
MSELENLPPILQEIGEALRDHLRNRLPNLDSASVEAIVKAQVDLIRAQWGGREVVFQKGDLEKIDHEKQLRFFF